MAQGGEQAAHSARRLSRAEALAASLPPLLVAAERVAATVSQGVHGRRRVGDGETFWQFRRYERGDPPQRIDWRQSAKSDRVYVRETEWEAAQSVWLWRDGSPSMQWRGSRQRQTKRERAELLLLALASLLTRGGEQVALLGERTHPFAGRAALRRMVEALERQAGTDSDGLPSPEPLPRHSVVVLFGDFLAVPEEVRAPLAALARKGVRGHLVQVLDPAEESLPFSGRVLFEGSERDGEVLVSRVEALRSEYRAAFARHQASLQEIARSLSWTLLSHRTDQSAQSALLALYFALAGTVRR